MTLFWVTLISLYSKAESVPALVDVGVGLGSYQIRNFYGSDQSTASIATIPIDAAVVIEKATIEKFKDKIPEQHRNAALKFGEVSIGHIAIPKTLYLGQKDHLSATGATWGFTPTISGGWGILKLGATAGPVLTLINFKDDRESKGVNFTSIGLRGGLFAKVPLFTRSLWLEAGTSIDYYIAQKAYGERSVSAFSGNYLMIHIRFPRDFNF